MLFEGDTEGVKLKCGRFMLEVKNSLTDNVRFCPIQRPLCGRIVKRKDVAMHQDFPPNYNLKQMLEQLGIMDIPGRTLDQVKRQTD